MTASLRRPILRAAAPLALLAGALAGCAPTTPPPPLMSPLTQTGSYGYGYSETELSDGRYEVVYVGPRRGVPASSAGRSEAADALRAEAEDLAEWRAAQLALAQDKPAFAVVERDSTVEVEVREEPLPRFWPSPYHVDHFGRPLYHPFYGFSPYSSFVRRDASARARVTLTVELREDAGGDTVDAEAAAERYRERYAAAPRG